MNDLTQKEISEINMNQQLLITLNTLKNQGFDRVVVNDGSVVIFATEFELTEDNAINFFCNGQKTCEIDLLSLVCIKSSIPAYVNIIVD